MPLRPQLERDRTSQAPGGFVRDWSEAGFPPARHYAYAAQWFGLALVGLVFLFRQLRKPK